MRDDSPPRDGGKIIVQALAEIGSALSSLCRRFRADSAVRSAEHAVSPRKYSDGSRIECYVDAELTSGNAVSCWLEFLWLDGEWIVESSIKHTTRNGQDDIVELPDRFAVDDEELRHELQGAVRALTTAADALDLEGL